MYDEGDDGYTKSRRMHVARTMNATAACAIGGSIGVWGQGKRGKGGGRTTTQTERGDEEREEERKRSNGGCSWSVGNTTRDLLYYMFMGDLFDFYVDPRKWWSRETITNRCL